jgi:hypothetical protein
MRARGGTRTAFQPLQTLDSPGNMRNPARSDPHTTQSDAQSVHSVHTPKVAFQRHSKEEPRPHKRDRTSSFRCDEPDNMRVHLVLS